MQQNSTRRWLERSLYKYGFCSGYARRFAGSERGGITLFTVVILIWMIVLGGMGVDFMRHEIQRADLQNAIDRGVLAATNLSAELKGSIIIDGVEEQLTEEQVAERIVNEYVSTRNMAGQETLVQVLLNGSSVNERSVVANARSAVPTIFFRMVGLDQFDVVVGAGAIQEIPVKTEIVLVLDISGSMGENTDIPIRDENNEIIGTEEIEKIELLKQATETFFGIVLGGDTDNVVISVVPFSSRVAVPERVADQLYLGFNRHHSFSTCFAFEDLDFTDTAIGMGVGDEIDQSRRYQERVRDDGSIVYGCPNQENNSFQTFTNNRVQLTNYVNSLTTERWTAAQIGMKFGVSLLDPAAAPIMQDLIDRDELPASFAAYPHDWNDDSARKFIVLMTDGRNTRLNSITDAAYGAFPTETEAAEFYDENNVNSDEFIIVEGSGPERVTGGEANIDLQRICTALKQKGQLRPDPNDGGLLIYTIGFEMADEPIALEQLRSCARPIGADPDAFVETYFEAEGAQLDTIFQAIADQIVDLQLNF
ncbi:MAG: pilus assembly protein TadG-related protein [Pseudomonadota bacterium]